MKVAELLQEFGHLFDTGQGAVLDLACGEGANGLYLKQQSVDVIFADIQQRHLDNLTKHDAIGKNDIWCADFESKSQLDSIALCKMKLQGVIVFRYLHRPLFDAIKKSIDSGGYIIYETFTEQNKQFGRPNKAQFLLQENELKTIFKDWKILFYFEGIKHNPSRAIAQIVCQKY